uniref:non-specific serine/threonine protein kinase n=1 Tax=Eutreptiella gymnastica TaxID=73025 RepID=A0A7S1N1X0_9EUGL|mmetsp:Transcript_108282/g.187036  ORF Transcript_108282/g.187036 Transcript_108282/m.187036 type:complete len:547 (+) Transcript_108282:108-1748(+)
MPSNVPAVKIPSCVGYRYKLRHKIGAGTFGFVFDAVDLNTGEIVAVKIAMGNRNAQRLLQQEARIALRFGGGKEQGPPEKGFPKFLSYGSCADVTYMVMERLGPNLDTLLKYNKQALSLKTVLLLASQMLTRIERFHNKGFLHRDIKPHNFTMGWGTSGFRLYLIDFGLTARFITPKSEHISFGVGKGLIGTPWFCSINAHDGCELSRRDDLESLFYVLVYLLRGSLPWQHVQNREIKLWSANIRQLKVSTTQILRELPEEFTTFYLHVRSLDFEEKPQYKVLRRLLWQVFVRHGFVEDNRFDWVAKQEIERKGKAEEEALRQEQQRIEEKLNQLVAQRRNAANHLVIPASTPPGRPPIRGTGKPDQPAPLPNSISSPSHTPSHTSSGATTCHSHGDNASSYMVVTHDPHGHNNPALCPTGALPTKSMGSQITSLSTSSFRTMVQTSTSSMSMSSESADSENELRGRRSRSGRLSRRVASLKSESGMDFRQKAQAQAQAANAKNPKDDAPPLDHLMDSDEEGVLAGLFRRRLGQANRPSNGHFDTI